MNRKQTRSFYVETKILREHIFFNLAFTKEIDKEAGLLACIPEVSGSNLGHYTNYTEVLAVFVSLPDKCRHVSNQAMTASSNTFSNSLFTDHPTTRRHTV
jgi:hypothetical protein